MAAKSFIEILEQEIRKDLREEIETQVRREMQTEKRQAPHVSAPESWETWLASNVEKTFFSRREQAKRTYKSVKPEKPQPEPKKASAPPPVQRLTAETFEAACAIELLQRHSGVQIPEAFTLMELKGAWRKAALKSHPDRFAQADQITQARAAALFRELAHTYELLEEMFMARAA